MVKVRLVVIEFSFECSRWLKAGLTLLAVNSGCMAGIKHKVDAAFDIGTKGDSLFQPLQKQTQYPPCVVLPVQAKELTTLRGGLPVRAGWQCQAHC